MLTIGLIRPWGEVFPGWLPVLRGRRAPTALPTAIGMAAGGTVTVAGRSFVQLVAAQPDTWPMLLIFPFPLRLVQSQNRWGALTGWAAGAGRAGRP